MPYDDGRNGARARSARIRASHDYEATQLDSMRRGTQESAQPEARLLTRLTAAFGRVSRSSGEPARVQAVESELEAVPARLAE